MRFTYTTISVLKAIADGVRYGFDIMDRTSLPSGTVYPILSRLERDGLVKSHWEDLARAHGDRRPPRRYYRLTREGDAALAAALERVRELRSLQAGSTRPAKSRA